MAIDSKPPAPIIIIRKRAGHGGQHGGAWKVAYADFVTAMMALFIVLWLLNSSEKVQKAVGGYFQDPTGKGNLAGSNLSGNAGAVSVSKDNMQELKQMLDQAMKTMPHFEQMKSQIEMIITGEGLRVELLETEKGMFFESGRGEPTESGTELLARLAQELGKLPNKLLVEGHTDAKPYSVGGTYTNWELSSDRANAARRLMQQHGVRPDQIAQVRGFADQRLRTTKDPVNPSNRRVSVIVLYQDKQPAPAQPAGGHEAAKSGDGHAAPASTSHAPAQVPAASHH